MMMDFKQAIISGAHCADTMPDLCFDPMFGSGAYLVAAHQAGRRFAGCEINPEAVSVAMKQLDNAGAKYKFYWFPHLPSDEEWYLSHENYVILGDSLRVLRAMPDQCVSLIYNDPPFGSDADKQFGLNWSDPPAQILKDNAEFRAELKAIADGETKPNFLEAEWNKKVKRLAKHLDKPRAWDWRLRWRQKAQGQTQNYGNQNDNPLFVPEYTGHPPKLKKKK